MFYLLFLLLINSNFLNINHHNTAENTSCNVLTSVAKLYLTNKNLFENLTPAIYDIIWTFYLKFKKSYSYRSSIR